MDELEPRNPQSLYSQYKHYRAMLAELEKKDTQSTSIDNVKSVFTAAGLTVPANAIVSASKTDDETQTRKKQIIVKMKQFEDTLQKQLDGKRTPLELKIFMLEDGTYQVRLSPERFSPIFALILVWLVTPDSNTMSLLRYAITFIDKYWVYDKKADTYHLLPKAKWKLVDITREEHQGGNFNLSFTSDGAIALRFESGVTPNPNRYSLDDLNLVARGLKVMGELHPELILFSS